MAYRILHCGKSVKNYNLCIEHKVAGFTRRGPKTGDIIFLAVRIKKGSVCGLKAVLGDPTDIKPWEDAENYVSCFVMDNVEYCKPFDLKLLKKAGGHNWGIKYFQIAKEIRDQLAIELLEENFNANKTETPTIFSVSEEYPPKPKSSAKEPESATPLEEPEYIEEPLSIMGTFQTIKFKNETDKFRGIETLVNDNFYNCFPQYLKEKTLLIPENRLFISTGSEALGYDSVRGIKGIPDAILILFNKQLKSPFQVSLIEYECFGEFRTRPQDKSDYLNGQIIP